MRRASSIVALSLVTALLSLPAFAGSAATADVSVDTTVISCGNGIPGGVNCILSKKDLKEAHDAYSHGRKLQEHQRLEEAFNKFDEASRLAPQNMKFFSAREVVKSQLVFQHTE